VRRPTPRLKVVENLAGYVQGNLLVPAELDGPWPKLIAADAAAQAWCTEVNARLAQRNRRGPGRAAGHAPAEESDPTATATLTRRCNSELIGSGTGANGGGRSRSVTTSGSASLWPICTGKAGVAGARHSRVTYVMHAAELALRGCRK
jgi:hypothetical protein